MRAPRGLAALAFSLGCSSSTTPVTDSGVSDSALPADVARDAAPDAPAACNVATSTEPDVVVTDRGALRGVTSMGVRSFRGVPYAAPPTGDLRWRAPSPAACWTDIRNANAFGPICPQLDAMSAPTGSEDCLTLNVWTPETAPATPLPVMFFLHGGGNNQGSSAAGGDTPVYDGRSLATRRAVVVTINYRLGALGFLNHPALDRESTDNHSGNYALLDAIAALRWVQTNIRRFGGDPSRVMLFGESAGGVNTCLLLASPMTAGLFSRALIESGGCGAQAQTVANAAGDRLLTATSCAGRPDPAACLRALSPQAILMAVPPSVTGISPTDFAASIDGRVVPRPALDSIRMGVHQHVPTILGTNRDEAGRLIAAATPAEGQFAAEARAYLSQYGITAAQQDAVIALYPLSDYPSAHAAMVALITDTRWTCPARNHLRTLRPAQSEGVYRYYFTKTLDPTRAPLLAAAGAYHGLELFYVFGSLTVGGYRPSANDLAASELIQGYWLRFAQTGDPNGAGATVWPGYDIARDPYLQLDVTATAGEAPRGAQCDALAAALR